MPYVGLDVPVSAVVPLRETLSIRILILLRLADRRLLSARRIGEILGTGRRTAAQALAELTAAGMLTSLAAPGRTAMRLPREIARSRTMPSAAAATPASLVDEAARWMRAHPGDAGRDDPGEGTNGLNGRILVGMCLLDHEAAFGRKMPRAAHGTSLAHAIIIAQARLEVEAADDPRGGWKLTMMAAHWYFGIPRKYGAAVTIEDLFGPAWDSMWTLPAADERREKALRSA